MNERLNILMNTINGIIEEYLSELASIIPDNSSLNNFKDKLNNAYGDIDKIVEIDLDELKEVLSEANSKENNIEQLIDTVSYLKTIIDLNHSKGTSFEIEEKQIKEVAEIIRIIEYIEEKRKQEHLDDDRTKDLEDKVKKLKELLGILEDDNNKEYINDSTTIKDLFDRSDLDLKTKKEILIEILKYNRNLFLKKQDNQELSEVNTKRLNPEDLRDIFNSYGYNYDELPEKYREQLLTYGILDNIKDLFEYFDKLNFPRFNMKKDGKKLVSILINSDPNTLNNIVNFSKQNNISPKDLLSLIPALVKQTGSKKKGHGPGGPGPGGEESLLLNGKSNDYVDNIKLLSSFGIPADDVFKKCKALLICKHEKLVHNIQSIIDYKINFQVSIDQSGKLVCPALTSLMSNNFEEIVDQFIEVSPQGYEYIKNNMSRTNYSDAKDRVFYNIYASYMPEDYIGNPQVQEGPFTRKNTKNLELRCEITNTSKYRNQPYRGITVDNKEERTMTIKPDIENKDEFDAVINKVKEDGSYVQGNISIPELEEYISPDNPLIYDFDGIRISKLKVSRIYGILTKNGLDTKEDSLLYAITYNTIINQENFDRLKDVIKNRRKNK